VEYQIPQFIEVEDKIFGPFTFRQFIFIAGGVGLCVLFFLRLNIILAVLLSLPVAGLTAALAFYRVNNKPFLSVIEAALKHYTKGRFYLWRKDDSVTATQAPKVAAPIQAPPTPFKGLTRGRLEEIARALDENTRQQ